MVFSGSLVVRGTAIAEVVATGIRSEIGKIGQSLAHAGDRAAAAAGADPPRGADLRHRRGSGQHSGGGAVRHPARRMAGCGAGGHRARHVDVAGRISGRACRVHGDGRVANLAGAGADPARRRHRNPRLRDGALHRQDRDVDRESDDHRRVAARGRRHVPAPGDTGHGDAGALPRAGRVRDPGQRARPFRPDGQGISCSRRRAAGRHRAPA